MSRPELTFGTVEYRATIDYCKVSVYILMLASIIVSVLIASTKVCTATQRTHCARALVFIIGVHKMSDY